MGAKKIAFGGVMAALSAVMLYMASILPTLRLAVCFIASAVICITMIKYGAREAVAVYLAVSAVSLIIMPDKLIPFGYILFFGNYPIVKAFLERVNKVKAEWGLKIIVFVIYALAAYAGMKLFFSGAVNVPFSEWLIIIGAVGVACIYDVALSLFISEFNRRFSKFI